MLPDWYLALSTVFMAIVTLLFLGLCVLVWKLIQAVNRIEPKVNQLMNQVNGEILPQVSTLMVKVNTLAENVNAMSSSARGSLEIVGGRAANISAALEMLAGQGTSKMKSVAPYVGLAMTALKLFRTFMDAKKSLPAKPRRRKRA